MYRIQVACANVCYQKLRRNSGVGVGNWVVGNVAKKQEKTVAGEPKASQLKRVTSDVPN